MTPAEELDAILFCNAFGTRAFLKDLQAKIDRLSRDILKLNLEIASKPIRPWLGLQHWLGPAGPA